jgi:hypothetical protein
MYAAATMAFIGIGQLASVTARESTIAMVKHWASMAVNATMDMDGMAYNARVIPL